MTPPSKVTVDKRLSRAGWLLVAMGVLHGVMTLVLFGDLVSEIVRMGLFSGGDWSLGHLAAFWFGLFTWLMIAMGFVIAGHARTGDPLPFRQTIGWSSIVIPILCGLILPMSGLWALIVPGLLLVGATDRSASTANPIGP